MFCLTLTHFLTSSLHCDSAIWSHQLGESLPAGTILPALPPKKIFGNMEPEFIESRRIALETYVQSVVRQPALARLPLVREFMPALLTRYAAAASAGSATNAAAPTLSRAMTNFNMNAAGNLPSHEDSSSSSWPRSAAAPQKFSAAASGADPAALSPLPPPHTILSQSLSAPPERIVTEFACHRVFMFSKNQSLIVRIHVSDSKIEFQVPTCPPFALDIVSSLIAAVPCLFCWCHYSI
jgi:hypothetical protein